MLKSITFRFKGKVSQPVSQSAVSQSGREVSPASSSQSLSCGTHPLPPYYHLPTRETFSRKDFTSLLACLGPLICRSFLQRSLFLEGLPVVRVDGQYQHHWQ